MAAIREEPLDEKQWEDQLIVSELGGVGATNIHVYFSFSPFCDASSNNKVLQLQARRDLHTHKVFWDRKLFEARLQQMSGLEYMVVDGPKENTDNMNPVWVIRQQRRLKRAGERDQITVLGTFFAVAHHIYQAPSVADMVAGHLSRVSYTLSDFFKTAADMQFFTSASGHSYLPPVQRPSLKGLGMDSTQNSRAGTPMPEASQTRSQTHASSTKSKDEPVSSVRAQGSLQESFLMSVTYGDEFMDENELTGEPGSMSFSSTQAHLRSQQEKKAASQQSLLASQRTTSRNASAQPTPPPIIKTEGLPRKSSKPSQASPVSAGPSKPKRRKSKAPTSPQRPKAPKKGLKKPKRASEV